MRSYLKWPTAIGSANPRPPQAAVGLSRTRGFTCSRVRHVARRLSNCFRHSGTIPKSRYLTMEEDKNSIPRSHFAWTASTKSPKLERCFLEVKASAIDDLMHRLSIARWPDEAPDQTEAGHWRYGTPVFWLRKLHEHWLHVFDWREQERALNALEQWRLKLDSHDLHFVHARAESHQAKPLLLLHGWPGSVFEFLELIPKLRQASGSQSSFHVVAASLPGFGLSFRKGQARLGLEAMADSLHHLMHDVLGYTKYFVQGGDWGSFIASAMAYRHPQAVSGIHLNLLPLRRDALLFQEPIDEDARQYAQALDAFLREDTGYQAIQGTRPQTLAYALNDSPLGLAAWIAEKFAAWSDCNGNPESVIPMDRMLANISFYWFTESIGASFWPYYARLHSPWFIPKGEGITVATGYCQFPREILKPPRSLAARTYQNIVRWHEADRGGHFAALEQTDVLAQEIRFTFDAL
ncbi:MAG: epoxide hydrolase [Betaproteobacteria bacterium]|nr:epoxide hydrolase [Betaproteobacteria bacterium]